MKKRLLCFDSDGTVMDTMTVKHVEAFGPRLFDAFPALEAHREEILAEWNRFNLYSATRGVNRFLGLASILSFASSRFHLEFPGLEEYVSYVESISPLSPETIEKGAKEASDPDCFLKALLWSDLVNASIRKLPKSHAFSEVKETLIALSSFADLLGVSSANPDAVKQEWEEEGIASLFRDIYCQDVGTKAEIIAKALALGYHKEDVVMIGDALGDLSAAEQNGVGFFPIIPSEENASWTSLREEVAPLIERGEYRGKKEKECVSSFHEFLNNGR